MCINPIDPVQGCAKDLKLQKKITEWEFACLLYISLNLLLSCYTVSSNIRRKQVVCLFEKRKNLIQQFQNVLRNLSVGGTVRRSRSPGEENPAADFFFCKQGKIEKSMNGYTFSKLID